MSHYIEKVTVSLENLISELARNPSLFLKNPDTDFSRNRKINFKTCVGITMNSGGCTLNKELLDFFDFDVNAPTVSAYTQQRAKILPEAFEYLFHAFTEENAQTKNLYEGYQLLACDGSNLTIAPNLNDPETLWKSNQLGATGNHLHLNALYDVLNRTYIDALVQTASTYQEHRASVMYVDEVKGIEFDKVFVVSAAMHRNEKYIAYTRALSELIVVVDEKLMNNNSAKKVKENIEHNKKAGIHSAKMPGTLKWEKTKQPKAYTLEKTIDNDVITYHFTENTKSIIKNEFANTDSILPSSIASSPLTNIKKNIYAHCVYIENSICYNINCKENMGKKCNKEGNCDYYISLPVPPDEEELIAEDIDNAKKYLAKYS